jgi:hypothetical protein
MRGMARNCSACSPTRSAAELDQMITSKLVTIMGELKRFLRRGGRPGVKQRKDDPF